MSGAALASSPVRVSLFCVCVCSRVSVCGDSRSVSYSAVEEHELEREELAVKSLVVSDESLDALSTSALLSSDESKSKKLSERLSESNAAISYGDDERSMLGRMTA